MPFPRHRRAADGARPRRRGLLIGLGTGGGVLAVAAIVLAVGLSQASDGPSCADALFAAYVSGSGGQVSGGQSATHYQLQGLPNCSYPAPPADGLYAALPAAEYASAARCGSYVQITGPHGATVRVKVVDQCPDCAAGHIDLSEAAFAKLAPLSAGLIDVSYAPVADPALPGPLTVQVKQGSSRYWLALLADNTGNSLSSVAVRSGASWLPMTQASYNYWITSSGAGPGPFTVRLTDSRGNQATLNGITLSPGVTQRTATLMYGAGGQQAAGPAATAATAGVPSRSPGATRSPGAAQSPAASLTPVAARSAAPAVAATPTTASVTAAPTGLHPRC
jgi:expansin (peptidoglycan-binding protein)